jgi:hypothetical protein
MTENRWKPLEKLAEQQSLNAARRATEQQRRLAAAVQQQETINAYAKQLGTKANAWVSGDNGCMAFLMRGVEQFHDTIHAVSRSQSVVLENLRDTRDAALQKAVDANVHRRKIAAIADRLDHADRREKQRAERKTEDDMTASRASHVDHL